MYFCLLFNSKTIKIMYTFPQQILDAGGGKLLCIQPPGLRCIFFCHSIEGLSGLTRQVRKASRFFLVHLLCTEFTFVYYVSFYDELTQSQVQTDITQTITVPFKFLQL